MISLSGVADLSEVLIRLTVNKALLKQLKNWLIDKSQTVVVNGESSLDVGVPESVAS